MKKKNTNDTGLQVSSIDIFPVKNPQGKLRAFAKISLNEQLQLTSLRIYDGSNGLFLSYPNDPSYKGEDYRQMFFPLTREFREQVEKEVIDKYTEVLSEVA